MRKPLVVLCAAAAALAAGGVAANALAQETPSSSEIVDFSYYEGEEDLLGPFPEIPEPVAQRPRIVRTPSEEPTTPPPVVVEKPRPRAEPQLRVRQAPGFARPAAVAAPAADPLAAARTAVTTASISASPAAPVQQQVLALVNRNRRDHGCGTIAVDRRLIDAANRHAADMARRGYFDHEDPRGDRAGSRVARAGYDWKRYGENIARGQNTPYEVVTDWMNSPEHRENILDCRLDEMGVGLAFDDDDTPYWVQDFATPR
ncbi:CAP domain-containing protein [Actinoplanes sp. NPDC051861]|uniref:CAP domain-containing protein n=1 Tax=Actinoplanes sp. NPDC051861 TaxID=3155170 RepID=UPI0034148DFF